MAAVKAAYGGVEFEAIECTLDSGRRIVTHEFPGKDTPYTEDLGRKARRWKIRGLLLAGPDEEIEVLERRLTDALDQAGARVLQHPTEGMITVRCEGYSIAQGSTLNTRDIDLAFVEAGWRTGVTTATSSLGQTASALAKVKAAIRQVYAARRKVLAWDDRIRRIISGKLSDRVDAILETAGILSGTDMEAYREAVRAYSDGVETWTDDAETLCDRWSDAVDNLSLFSNARAVGMPLLDEGEAASARVGDATTPSDTTIAEDDAGTAWMFASIALARVAELAVDVTYTAFDDAVAARDDLSGQLARLSAISPDAETYDATRALLAAAVGALDAAAIDLPRLRTITVSMPRTAVGLAHALYGDPSRATEIIDRNRIADPNIVSGTLRVLSE